MEIFNVGIPEFIFIILIALIVLGPQDMVKTARKLGVWVNKIVRSPIWASIMSTSRELRDLPTKIVREAGLDELQADAQKIGKELNKELKETLDENKIEMPNINISTSSAQADPPKRIHPQVVAEPTQEPDLTKPPTEDPHSSSDHSAIEDQHPPL
mgnify:CR=1 FL=1